MKNVNKKVAVSPSRPLICSTAREKERPFSHLSNVGLKFIFDLAEAHGDDLTCCAVLDEKEHRKLVVTE